MYTTAKQGNQPINTSKDPKSVITVRRPMSNVRLTKRSCSHDAGEMRTRRVLQVSAYIEYLSKNGTIALAVNSNGATFPS